nr:glucose-6-phosphate isomerase [Gammaproteobacteria bacterium]
MTTPNKISSAQNLSAQKLLHIDTRRLYETGTGAQGVGAAEMNALLPELQRAHQTLVKKSETGLEAEYACLNLHTGMQSLLPTIQAMAENIRRYRDVAVIGIGGSSLGAKAVHQALSAANPDAANPRLHFLENIDSYRLHALLQNCTAENLAVICISKSGGTMETAVQYLILRAWLEKNLGKEKARQQQWIVTDPSQGWLRDLAQREGIAALPVPPKVGGRYSVLTAVGLLPLAAVGVDIQGLLAGASANAARCVAAERSQNPALELAALFYLLDIQKDKRISIMMPYVDPLAIFGDWYCQLWAESLGKRMQSRPGKPPAGTLPVRAMGAVDQHSQLQMYLESRLDKIFSFIALDNWDHDFTVPLPPPDQKFFPHLAGKHMHEIIEAEFQATRQVITETGHPNMTLRLPALNAHVLGQLIDLYQRVTVYTGLLYGINPLDQPAVEKGKKLAVQLLSANPTS